MAHHICTILLLVCVMGTLGFLPSNQDHFLTDALLREVVDRMGKDLADAADVYIDFPDHNDMSEKWSNKDLESQDQQMPIDYETSNPNPSIRDQEFLQHSSLWGHQYVTGGAGEGKQRLKPDGTIMNQKEVKTDASLPAYCNPPNPCPVGYTVDDGCLEQFENTAVFSRDYQSAQDCMCDSEHMFDCPSTTGRELTGGHSNDISDSDLDRIIEQFQVEDQHKSLVAKKFHAKKNTNPYLKGERLPVAAKKGNNVIV